MNGERGAVEAGLNWYNKLRRDFRFLWQSIEGADSWTVPPGSGSSSRGSIVQRLPNYNVQITLTKGMAMPSTSDQLLRVFASPRRAYVLDMLESRGEMSVNAINEELGQVTQSALSQHLKIMRDAEVVETRRASQTIYYRVADDPAVRELIEWRRRHRR